MSKDEEIEGDNSDAYLVQFEGSMSVRGVARSLSL